MEMETIKLLTASLTTHTQCEVKIDQKVNIHNIRVKQPTPFSSFMLSDLDPV